MKIAVITLTGQSVILGRQITLKLSGNGHDAELYVPQEFDCETNNLTGRPYVHPLKDLIKDIFTAYEGIVCIMAMGIVVRLISPLLQSKIHDPAVVVIDELGRNVISVLSGHWGKANNLTREISALTGASPVITTATDVNGLPAIDVLARDHGLLPEPVEMIRKINADILKGKKVTIYTKIPFNINFSAQLMVKDISKLSCCRDAGTDTGIDTHICADTETDPDSDEGEGSIVVITNKKKTELAGNVLYLRPTNIIAGIGCRKGVSMQEICKAIKEAFVLAERSPVSLQALASVDIKKDEAGLLGAAEQLGVPVAFYSTKEINGVMRDKTITMQFSETVHEKIGVGGVCEPAAVLKAGSGAKIIMPKTIIGRVTIALAEVN